MSRMKNWELSAAVAVRHMFEVADEWGNPRLITDQVNVDGEPATVHLTWDAGLEVIAEVAGDMSMVADLRWSYNDGCLKLLVLGADGHVIDSAHLAGITREALIADWEHVYGFPYNDELGGVAA